MIDGIEFAMVDQILGIGYFNYRHAIFLEQHPNTRHKTISVRYMGKHVVSMDDIGLFTLCTQFLRQFLGEEGIERGDARACRLSGRTISRIDSQYRNVVFQIIA